MTDPHLTPRERSRVSMLAILMVRKDERYRRGIIQMAVCAGVITNEEWESLDLQIRARKTTFKLEC
jgi:hypothetical protein